MFGARGEVLLAVAGDDDHVNVVVEARVEDARVELLEHLVRVRVDGRVVERHDRNPLVRRVVYERPHSSTSLGLRGTTGQKPRSSLD